MEDTDFMMKQHDHDRELYEENEGRKILRELLIADIKSKNQDEGYFTDYNDDNELDIFFLTLSPTKQRLLEQAQKKWEMMPDKDREDTLVELRKELWKEEKKTTEIPIDHSLNVNDTSNKFSTNLLSDKIAEFMEEYTEQKTRAKSPPAVTTIEAYNSAYREFLFVIGNDTRMMKQTFGILTYWNA